jgi:hypothetical protein
MPLREKMTRSNSAVPRGNPSVGLEDPCSIGTVMDGAGVRSCSLFICTNSAYYYLAKSPELQGEETGYIYTHTLRRYLEELHLHVQRMILTCTVR